MDDFDRQLLAQNSRWQQVLEAYLELTTEVVERPAEQTGPRWSDRIISMNDMEPAELSAIHGQLIALGWLKFQFEIGQTGLMYRVSSEGRTVLNRVNGTNAPVAVDEETSSDDLAA